MLVTKYVNEQGVIDKVVLQSESPEDAKVLLDAVEHFQPTDYITASAAFPGTAEDPNLITLEAEQAKLDAAAAAYKASLENKE